MRPWFPPRSPLTIFGPLLLAVTPGAAARAELAALPAALPVIEAPQFAAPAIVEDEVYGSDEAVVPGEDTASGGSPFDWFGDDECEPWGWQCLPDGIVYPAYLAGVKESRLAGTLTHLDDGWFLDGTLGGRIGLIRYGTIGDDRPQGWQLDVEGAALPRIDLEEERDLISADFRIGLPLTYAAGGWEYKLAAYHLSSHVGDEFLLKNPDFERLNYSRDAVVLGAAYRLLNAVRLYGEAGWSFNNSGDSEPWEFQFGLEYSPAWRDAPGGMPFAAANAHLREELDFGGYVTLQAGWQWRSENSGRRVRLGIEYFQGKSPQFEFLRRNEEHLALGLWYDY